MLWVCVAIPQSKKGECNWLAFYFTGHRVWPGIKKRKCCYSFHNRTWSELPEIRVKPFNFEIKFSRNMVALLKKQKFWNNGTYMYLLLKSVDGSRLPSVMINPDSEKNFQNHMWLMATKTKVLTFHYLSCNVIMVYDNA